MSQAFSPRTEILPPPQRALWPDLIQIPEQFVLWGGTAVALHLGHRESVDFDFFSNTATDIENLIQTVPILKEATVLQREPGTLNVQINRGGPVKMSFFMVPGVLTPINPPLLVPDNKLKVASLLDLAAMKVKVVSDRAEAKDYIDIAFILRNSKITLPEALAAAGVVYGKTFNPLPSLKALSYFGDGNLTTLPNETKDLLLSASAAVDLAKLPTMTRAAEKDRS